MADEQDAPPPTPAPSDSAPATAPAPAPPADVASRADVVDLRQQVAALTDTLKAALTRPPQTAMQPNADMANLPDAFVALLKQQGLTDADIKHNAPIVAPFLRAMLATDGAVLTGGIQQVQDEIEMVKAARNEKLYPHWSDLEETVVAMRDEARKNGRYLTPRDAYQAAVAADIARPESKIEQARARRRQAAAESAGDATANELGHRGSAARATAGRTAVTAESLASMSRDERKKYFEQVGDLPIK